jgi:hypothetical protein
MELLSLLDENAVQIPTLLRMMAIAFFSAILPGTICATEFIPCFLTNWQFRH